MGSSAPVVNAEKTQPPLLVGRIGGSWTMGNYAEGCVEFVGTQGAQQESWLLVFCFQCSLLLQPECPDLGQGHDFGGGVLAYSGGAFCLFLEESCGVVGGLGAAFECLGVGALVAGA